LGFNGLGHLYPHHGAVHGVAERVAAFVLHPIHLVAAVEVLGHQHVQLRKGHGVLQAAGAGEVGVGVFVEYVLFELEPEVAQFVGGIVEVGDRFGAGNALLLVVEFHLDVVVGPLLPVGRSRRPGGRTVRVGRGQHRPQLLKLRAVFLESLGPRRYVDQRNGHQPQ
jgi:hypothetical protein